MPHAIKLFLIIRTSTTAVKGIPDVGSVWGFLSQQLLLILVQTAIKNLAVGFPHKNLIKFDIGDYKHIYFYY